MNKESGYKQKYEKKTDRIEVRLDESMLTKLQEIRRITGISVSESVREAIRRLIKDVDNNEPFELII